MATQIYINTNQCKPEYTKIAAHSFSMGLGNIDLLFYGGKQSFTTQAIWSKDIYDFANSRFAPSVKIPDKAVGIPLPINLVADDIVTLSGTAYFNNFNEYTNLGWEVYFSLGVYYFDCKNNVPETPAFTFIPVATYPITVQTRGSICFEEMVTLNSNFDIHETRFLVGFSVYIICPEGEICDLPSPEQPDLATVSYTFDIERPCAVITSESNFIIRNCCEPIITELVNIPGLQVGSFHVDDEGNCWEVVSSSTDVTNFTRNFVDVYDSCVECQTANPCPQNLAIASCCVQGVEFVTGSLPGLNVGDTFVDNNGLCWTVQFETGAPISEESITVDTIIPGDCADCTTANPCPDFWKIESCCGKLEEVIATTIPLSTGDSFLDTNGICWSVRGEVFSLPTNYDIVVDSVYTLSEDNCLNCTTDNPCPTEYFLTIRNCCDNDRVEVAQVPAAYMSFSEGLIFSDAWGICWEVMSYDTTGVETYPIWNWPFGGVPNNFQNCQDCIKFNADRKTDLPKCNIYEVVSCIDSNTYTVISSTPIVIGQFYFAQTGVVVLQCFEVIGYGTYSFASLGIIVDPVGDLLDCTECS